MFPKFSKNRILIIIAAVILVVFLMFKFFGKSVQNESFTVKRSTVLKEVLVSGKTKARNSVDLGFDKSGRVARVYADVGDSVIAGSIIAELNISTELANLQKERASLSESEANVGNDSKKLESLIREGFRAADNAVRNRADQFFKTPRTNPSFEVKFSDGNFVNYFKVPSDIAIDLNNSRKSLETLLLDWQKELSVVSEANAQNYASLAVDRLSQVFDFLNKIAYAVNEFTPSEFAYEATVEGYKTTINSARSEISNAQEAVISASSGNVGLAKINQVKASIASLEAGLQGTRLVAPFTGVVTRQDLKVGSIVSANSVVTSLISDDDMYIEANVSEVNISKIKIGNEVKIEFDSEPGVIYVGKVSYIDPAETLVDGVVNYKIRVEIEDSKTEEPKDLGQIRSGLTANLQIETAREVDVLAIPNFIIVERDGKKYVNKIISPKESVEVEVETGLVGSDGLIEIKSGLIESDVVEFVKK